MAGKKYWLMKSEPDVYSIDNLKKDGSSLWDGVRNYQARNFMMNDMKPGDQVLFYHSNANPPGVAGLAEIAAPAEPDPTAFDKKSKYFDSKSSQENPRWYCVRVKHKKTFKELIPLDQLKNESALKDMMVTKKGMRLSIQPVSRKEFVYICKIAGVKA